ncbi:hypothetical protein ScPMuIL_006270 [Solemya velum]
MASTGVAHWEVVGKSKKVKGPTPHLTKTQKKNWAETMPRIDPLAPVKESSTIYDAFLEKEKARAMNTALKGDKSQPKDITGARNGIAVKKSASNKKKQKSEQDKKKTESLDEAVSKITKAQLEGVMEQSQSCFPENPEVWLKDLVSYLNLKLEDVPAIDPLFKDKEKEFPLCCLAKNCRSLLLTVLKNCSMETKEHLLYHSLQQILTDNIRSNNAYGYKIFIQLLVQQEPAIASSKLSQYQELIKSNQNQPVRCLSILWSLGQCGISNFKGGLKVWLGLMFPSLSVRSVSSYCVEYLERLFSIHTNLKPVFGDVTVRDYFHILDLVFHNTNMSGDLRKRLLCLYPKLKEIAYGSAPSTNLRNFFPSYLSRLTPGTGEAMKTELLSCLCACLRTDKQSFSLWCQMYTKHLQQSSILMQHISDNWDKVGLKMEQKVLHETMRSFSVTNDEMASQGQTAGEACTTVCKELLLKMTKPRFPWRWLVFGVLFSLMSLVCYDMMSSRLLRASRTVQFLENYGILGVAQQSWSRISTYAVKGYSWLLVNIPIYYSELCAVVGPYVWFAWTKLVDGVAVVLEVTAPYRRWLLTKFMLFIEWIYAVSPSVWATIGNYLLLLWDFFRDTSFWIWKNITEIAFLIYHWTEENIVLSEISLQSVQNVLRAAILSLQNGLNVGIQWVGSFLASGAK